ncbi:hypothetical protein SLS62_004298 [Diatrype stigma]|uniref:Uncharacterized protein n=1 Tax=Diatrype stigma TaxID=117547 RepID=A0AAN9UUH3_9PEZI
MAQSTIMTMATSTEPSAFGPSHSQSHSHSQTRSQQLPSAALPALSTLPSADLEKIHEYQKIIEFRDTILAGKHPRIKVPASTQGKSSAIATSQPNAPSALESAPPSAPSLPSTSGVNEYHKENMQSFKTNSQQPAVAVGKPSSSANPAAASRAFGSGKTEINPVLLEKSDDLIKAELQLQRQRLEKSLRDQIEERKAAMKAALQQPEPLQDLDLSDIFAKALTVVQATSAPITSDANINSNATDSGDSFDDNTFYSSQHDTPELTASPRAPTPSQDVPMQLDAPESPPQNDAYSPTLHFNPAPFPIATLPLQQPQPHVGHSAPLVSGARSAGQFPQSNGAPAGNLPKQTRAPQVPFPGDESNRPRQARRRDEIEAQVISSGESGAASRCGDSGNTDSDQPTDSNRMQNLPQLSHNTGFRTREPPVVRAHNLSPYAPQPAHVSPLALAHQPHITQPDISVLQAAPAPVAALRQQQQQAITSPESSPQGDRGGKKKKNKKNKRKADNRTHTAPTSPDIKPEPRSPSPLSAPQFARPPKRQRPLQRQAEDLAYDEPILERPVSRVQREYHAPIPVQEERLPYGWERAEEPYARQLRYSVAPASQRPEHIVYEDRRPERIVYEERGPGGAPIQYVRRIQSPLGYTVPYGGSEERPMRSASYSVAQPIYQEASAYPRNGRVSVRPYLGRGRSRSPVMTERRSPPIMGPPIAPPTRILVDEYGRQYIEPIRPATTRPPVMPSNGPENPEIIYERAPVRAPSRMAGVDTFEQDGVIYRRASPAVPSRRVVTQPDYRGTEYRGYRERDYPVQPAHEHPREYVQYGGAADRRIPEDFTREYLPRSASVRPAETVPYGRLQSTRPEIPPRQYAASVHPEARREAMPPMIPDYGVRPVEAELPRREFSVRPVERYYERPLPRDDEVTYIERPRAAEPEVVYADDPRGPMYRQHG